MPRRQSRSVYDALPCSPQRAHFLRRASGVGWINPAFDGKKTARPTTRLLPPVNDFPVAVNDRAGVDREDGIQRAATDWSRELSIQRFLIRNSAQLAEPVRLIRVIVDRVCWRLLLSFRWHGNDRSLLDRVVFLVLQCLPLLCAQSLPFCFR